MKYGKIIALVFFALALFVPTGDIPTWGRGCLLIVGLSFLASSCLSGSKY